jgi:hypothetical protein
MGVGINFNTIFQHTFDDWVVLHNEMPISRDIPRLLMVADGRAKDGDDEDAGEPPVDDATPIDPEKAKKLAMSNHRKVGVGMVMHPDSPAYHAVLAKQMLLQQHMANDSLKLSRAAHDRLEYAKAALAEEYGLTYVPKPRAYCVATQQSGRSYEAGAHKLLAGASELYVLLPEHRNRTISAPTYRCTIGGLGIMRRKVWVIAKKGSLQNDVSAPSTRSLLRITTSSGRISLRRTSANTTPLSSPTSPTMLAMSAMQFQLSIWHAGLWCNP